MSAGWFYARSGQRFGPFSFDQFRQMAASGLLAPEDMVCGPDTGGWGSAGSVAGLFPGTLPAPSAPTPKPPPPPTGVTAASGVPADPVPVLEVIEPLPSVNPAPQQQSRRPGPNDPGGDLQGGAGRQANSRDRPREDPHPRPRPAPDKDRNDEDGQRWEEVWRRQPRRGRDGGRQESRDRDGDSRPRRDKPPRLLDVLLAVAILLSIPMWCLNEFIGRPFLILAGLIWIVAAVRAVATGSLPSFTGRVHRNPALYRTGGVLVGLLGLGMVVTGTVDVARGIIAGQGAQGSASPDARGHLQRGIDLSARHDFAGAEGAFSEAIRLDPTFAEAHARRGAVRTARGDPAAGVNDCTEAIRLDPRLALAHAMRGWARLRQGDNDGAVRDCTEALRLEPGLYDALLYRGAARSRRGEFGPALADLDEAVRLRPEAAEPRGGRALVYLTQGEHDRAVADCTEAVRLDPTYAAGYQTRGLARLARGDAEGVEDLDRAIDLDPTGAVPAYLGRASYRAGRGDFDKALADCTEAIRLAPNSPHGYKHRGDVYRAKGDEERAREDYRQAQEFIRSAAEK